MQRNQLPGTDIDLSVIGIALPATGEPNPLNWKTSTDRARDAGVNLFDLTGSSVDREAYFRQGLERRPEPIALLVRRSTDRLAARRRRSAPDTSEAGGDELGRQLSDSLASLVSTGSQSTDLLVEWDPSPGEPAVDQRAAAELGRLVKEGRIAGWGVRSDGPTATPNAATAKAGFICGEVSLLERPEGDSRPWSGLPLFARDPMASGRLDGSRFDSTTSPLSFGQRPVPVATIRDEFEPVVRLGPLVLLGERALPQVALHYVIDVIGAVTALVTLPDPRRLGEILSFGSSPPLNEHDVKLIDGLPRPPSLARHPHSS